MLIESERVSADFIQYDRQSVYKDTIIRIITSEKIFFFFHSQFDNTDSFLHQLKSGDEIIAAGHPLNNGGYWLHWAILDDNNELAPENKYDEGQSLLKYLACSTLASLVSFLMIIDGIESIFIAVLFLFTLIMNIFFVKELIISAISPLNESVIIYQKEKGIVDKPFFNKKVYNLIKRHRPKIFSIVNGSSFKKQNSNFSIDDYELINKKAENLGLNVKLFDIKEIKIKSNMAVSHLRINNNRKRIQTPNNYYLISDGCNEFYCKTHNSSLAKEVLTKIQHPFFVALKDKVEVISDVDNHQVIGLYNHTDESAYLFKPSNHIDYNEMTPKVALVSSIIFFLIIFISTSMVSLYFRADFFMVTVLFFASMVIPIMIYSLHLFQKKKYFKSTQLDRFLIVKNYLQYCLRLNHNKSCVNVVLNTEHPTGFNTIVLNDDREDKK